MYLSTKAAPSHQVAKGEVEEGVVEVEVEVVEVEVEPRSPSGRGL